MKKRIIPVLLSLCLTVSLFSGCGKSSSGSSDSTYRQLYSGEVSTLNYLVTSTTNDFSLSANVIDTLVEYDNYGNIQPSLATDWSMSDDGLTYTFHIRKDQKWVDYSGKEVADITANDFVSSMKYLLTSEYESTTANLLFGIIKNAEEYYNGTLSADDPETEAVEGVPIDFSEVGVKAVDDYTLEYTLAAPCPYFLSSLTYVCYMPAYGPLLEELGAGFGAATGPNTLYYCGAYRLSEFRPQEKRVYTKNTSNWDADKVYIGTIDETYNSEASTLAPTMVLRDEVDYAAISSDIIGDWLGDATKSSMLSKGRAKVDYSYFYTFNFDPQFDAEYEPDNWRLAVNNENFRQALMAGLDRAKALSVSEKNDPQALFNNTITPKTFCSADGKDYTEYSDLAAIVDTDSFNAEKALEYKEKAVAELTAQGAKFPVKVLMKYKPSDSNWTDECVIVEQQLENLLGTDFIDIVVEAGPTENFLSETRRNGNYAFMRCNWGADYADPDTWAAPFAEGNNYNFMDVSIAEKSASADTIEQYYALVSEAATHTTDLAARYESYAKAEAYLINHALVVPFSISTMDYQVTKVNPYEGQYASFGVSTLRYKGQHLLDKAISMEESEANKADWEKKMAEGTK